LGCRGWNKFPALITLPNSGIEKPADLRGRRIGLPRRVNDQIDFWRATSLRGILSTLELAIVAVKIPAESEQGVANGLNFTLSQLGIAFGISTMAAVFDATKRAHGSSGVSAMMSGFHAANLMAAGLLILSMLGVVPFLGPDVVHHPETPLEPMPEAAD
jgi:hypothetical protein